MECSICKKKIEEDCLFTRMCKKCTGQLDLENSIRDEVLGLIQSKFQVQGDTICLEMDVDEWEELKEEVKSK